MEQRIQISISETWYPASRGERARWPDRARPRAGARLVGTLSDRALTSYLRCALLWSDPVGLQAGRADAARPKDLVFPHRKGRYPSFLAS